MHSKGENELYVLKQRIVSSNGELKKNNNLYFLIFTILQLDCLFKFNYNFFILYIERREKERKRDLHLYTRLIRIRNYEELLDDNFTTEDFRDNLVYVCQ